MKDVGALPPLSNEDETKGKNTQIEGQITRDAIKSDLLKNRFKGVSEFPVWVFSFETQEIIDSYFKALKYPIDYFAGGILSALSVALGNTYSVSLSNGYTNSGGVYLVLVGDTGVNKSAPLRTALEPINVFDRLKYNDYKSRLKEFEQAQKEGTVTDAPPVYVQTVLKDTTPEALVEKHFHNQRGVVVYNDEIIGWAKKFGRYNKNDEEEFYLSAWQNDPVTVNRKTDGVKRIERSFISVTGTIQPALLSSLFSSRVDNGFFYRFLFCYPDAARETWSQEILPAGIEEKYHRIIQRALDIPLIIDNGAPIPKKIYFSKGAEEIVRSKQKNLVELSNEMKGSQTADYTAKMDIYLLRFALLLEIEKYASSNAKKYPEEVSEESAKGACHLVDYFMATFDRIINVLDDPLSSLSKPKQEFYKRLPQTVETQQAIEFGKDFQLSERTIKRFLNERQFFERVSHGKYEKLL